MTARLRSSSNWLLLASIVLGTTIWAPAAAHADAATDSVAAVGALNALRTEMGEQPVIEDPTVRAHCGMHVDWMVQNRQLSHPETPGSPGYSAEGNAAGRSSVLSYVLPGAPQTTPDTIHWRVGSPLHLSQLLHPALTRSGYAWREGYACMGTLDRAWGRISIVDRSRAQNAIFTWPANGSVRVPTGEDTRFEAPSPNELLGLPRTKRTGPYILFFASGFGSYTDCTGTDVVTATLTGPGGANVPVKVWDDASERAKEHVTGVGQCTVPSGGGLLVPVSPLRPNTTYVASISVQGIGRRPRLGSRTWKFSTGPEIAGGLAGTGNVAAPAAVLASLRSTVLPKYPAGAATFSFGQRFLAAGAASWTLSVKLPGTRLPKVVAVSRARVAAPSSRRVRLVISAANRALLKRYPRARMTLVTTFRATGQRTAQRSSATVRR